jgi:hypothetical protein
MAANNTGNLEGSVLPNQTNTHDEISELGSKKYYQLWANERMVAISCTAQELKDS